LAFVTAMLFGEEKLIAAYYFSWRIIFLPIFYLISLVIMEFLYKKLNTWLQKKLQL
jgi:hypothetical protein